MASIYIRSFRSSLIPVVTGYKCISNSFAGQSKPCSQHRATPRFGVLNHNSGHRKAHNLQRWLQCCRIIRWIDRGVPGASATTRGPPGTASGGVDLGQAIAFLNSARTASRCVAQPHTTPASTARCTNLAGQDVKRPENRAESAVRFSIYAHRRLIASVPSI